MIVCFKFICKQVKEKEVIAERDRQEKQRIKKEQEKEKEEIAERDRQEKQRIKEEEQEKEEIAERDRQANEVFLRLAADQEAKVSNLSVYSLYTHFYL